MGTIKKGGRGVEVHELVERNAKHSADGKEIEGRSQTKDFRENDRDGGGSNRSSADSPCREDEREHEVWGIRRERTEGAKDDHPGGCNDGEDVAEWDEDQQAENGGQGFAPSSRRSWLPEPCVREFSCAPTRS